MGKLTSIGYKKSDPNMAEFLKEWNKFFPHLLKGDQWKVDGECPQIVEIFTCKIYFFCILYLKYEIIFNIFYYYFFSPFSL